MDGEMSKGFPRPHNREYNAPAPYSAAGVNDLATVSSSRVSECIQEGLCTVCGDPINTPSMWIAIFANYKGQDPHGALDDPGFAHEKCMKIVSTMCPYFKSKKAYYLKVLTAATFITYRQKFSDDNFFSNNIYLDEIKVCDV